jgi:energy-coupling factor transport system permease protein
VVTRADVAKVGGRSGTRAAPPDSLHAGAWVVWLLAVSAFAFVTSNPLYLSLALIAAFGAYLSVRDSPKGRAMTPFVALCLALAALSVPFNLLTGSSGATVLLEAPSLTFPDWFGGVTLGGDVTAEALVAATGRALSIATLVVAAAAFNSGVDHFRLLKLAPRGLAQVAVVFTIAALVIPQGLAQARAVAEGRRLRGRPGRGLRALPGLVLPVLQGALERSVQRAESLEARGFGGRASAPPPWSAYLGVGGLGLAAWGAFSHFYSGPDVPAALAMAGGGALVVAALYGGRARASGGLRPARWTVAGRLLLAASSLGLALIIYLRVTGAGDATYLPYPDVTVPGFHALGALAAALLLAPALVQLARRPSEEVT